ncbi:MAG TPA: CDP-alcohol phosphatidyltransferase family protein [Chitinophagaceae bacterium]|nr:CDP-alcohol phosphatidyltransferase family protein [Chitinophagaceae bacterium]
MKQLPNIFTLLNLVAGFLACIFILQTGETILASGEEGFIITLPEKIIWGSACIGIAAVIDFLDGFVARLFNATSEMGKQLDSLADVVSFGVAPGLIIYQLLRITFAQQEDGLEVSLWALMPAVLIPCAGAYRLARFNIDKSQQYGFKGVPVPAAGLVIASLPLILFYNYYNINEILLNKWVLYGITILVSWLMISKLPLLSLKFANLSVKSNVPKLVLLIIAVIAAILLKWLAVPVVFICYIIVSLLDGTRARRPKAHK